MFILFICDIPWWLPLLGAFLAGLLLGWALWAKYQSMVEDLEKDISGLKRKISTLEGDLDTCRSRRADLEGDLALAKGRLREMEAEIASLKTGGDGDVDLGLGAAALASSLANDSRGSGDVGVVADTSGGTTDIYAGIPQDNLQVIEGIGPKMSEVLRDSGVDTWAALAAKSPDDVQAILNNYGDKYRIIDPSTWPEQAALARDGEWEKLINLQKNLSAGTDSNINQTNAKVEKMMVKLGLIKKYKQDDLKAVEGIGPKISQLLHDAGIKTWRELSQTAVEKIQSILDEAGPRYKLADPGTWPKQAELAADGKWKELQKYQDFLQGGK